MGERGERGGKSVSVIRRQIICVSVC
jgi:hypothetical protein